MRYKKRNQLVSIFKLHTCQKHYEAVCVVVEMMERGDLRLTDQRDHVSNKQALVICHGGIIETSVSVLTCSKMPLRYMM